jgi:hypothetical protein
MTKESTAPLTHGNNDDITPASNNKDGGSKIRRCLTKVRTSHDPQVGTSIEAGIV